MIDFILDVFTELFRSRTVPKEFQKKPLIKASHLNLIKLGKIHNRSYYTDGIYFFIKKRRGKTLVRNTDGGVRKWTSPEAIEKWLDNSNRYY